MRLFHPIKLVIALLCLLLAAGCSSSSYTSRYNKPKSEDTESNSKPNRFSSKDDPLPSETKNEVYNDPGVPEFDEIPVEDHPVNKEVFIKNYKHLEKLGPALTEREKMLFAMVQYLDTPYKYGGNGFNGIDCSAFTQNIFTSTVGVVLPRTASEQYRIGESIDKSSLEFGDLVFFNTTRNRYPGHVGIYIGNDMFVHASSSLGVTISSMNSTYFNSRYIGGKRIENIASN